MDRFILVLIVLATVFASCDKEARPLTKEEIAFKVDSISKERIKELSGREQKELEHRIKIEVKIKADSIVTARMQQQAKDTLPAKNTPK